MNGMKRRVIPVHKNADSYSALVAKPHAPRTSVAQSRGPGKQARNALKIPRKTTAYHLRLWTPDQRYACSGSVNMAPKIRD